MGRMSIGAVLVALPLLLLPGSQVEEINAAPAAKEKVSPVVKKLCEQRVILLRKATKVIETRVKRQVGNPSEYLEAARRLHEAELALAFTRADRIKVHLAYFKSACWAEEVITAMVKAGTALPLDQALARAARLSAEIDLRQAGGAPPKEVKPLPEERE